MADRTSGPLSTATPGRLPAGPSPAPSEPTFVSEGLDAMKSPLPQDRIPEPACRRQPLLLLQATLASWFVWSACALGTTTGHVQAMTIGKPLDRPDRLIALTGQRPESLLAEYSADDGVTWKPYRLRYNIERLDAAPPTIPPGHMPRLDWQMWFAALGRYDSPRNLWFGAFIRRLLEGQPTVLELLASNPFPNAPPTYIRCRKFLYTFSDVKSRKANGLWWNRECDDMVD